MSDIVRDKAKAELVKSGQQDETQTFWNVFITRMFCVFLLSFALSGIIRAISDAFCGNWIPGARILVIVFWSVIYGLIAGVAASKHKPNNRDPKP